MPVKNDISHATRLFPGNDLKTSIEKFVAANNIQAGWIVTCVGSITEFSIRFANKLHVKKGSGYFEIINLSGTVSTNGSHLHICIADVDGNTIAGHLMEGCKIYTTAEIVLVESGKYIFEREKDVITSWKELQIKNK